VDNPIRPDPMCKREPVNTVQPDDSVELVLGPATRLLWRSPTSVHLELGSRAVVVDGLPTPLIRRVASPVAPPDDRPAVDAAVRHALLALTEAGYLWPRSITSDDPRLTPPDPRLAGELAALAVQHSDHAAEVLSARRHSSVEIDGRSRVAAHLAAVLAAAGVGRIHCAGDGAARLLHAVPGGVTVSDEGSLLAVAAEAAIHRAAPGADTTPLPLGERPDLTVLAVDAPVSDERRDALHAADAPYLAVTLGIDHGVVGPLVLPGLTGCLQCADLHRRDRDPAWSALAVQLTVGRRHGPVSDVAMATVIAGVAAQQALTFLDGGEPACIDGTIELRLPDWRLRRRSWPAHPECGCSAPVTRPLDAD
jgi:bacteriocin biosynthesis cyclodehydratase domain-containing protein